MWHQRGLGIPLRVDPFKVKVIHNGIDVKRFAPKSVAGPGGRGQQSLRWVGQ